MATTGGSNVDIWVHSAAPSNGRHDFQYRALARAYLDFEPEQRLKSYEELEAELGAAAAELASSHLQEEFLQSTQEERESEASFRPIEDHESGASTQQKGIYRIVQSETTSSQLSFKSVQHNLDSPAFKWQIGGQDVSPGTAIQSQESWVAPPSTVADSQPEPVKIAAILSSPTTVLENILRLQRSELSAAHEQDEKGPIDQSTQLPVTSKPDVSSLPEAHASIPNQPTSSVEPPTPCPRRANAHPPNVLTSLDPNIPSSQDNHKSLKRKKPESSEEADSRPPSSAPCRLTTDLCIISSFETPNKRIRLEGLEEELNYSDILLNSRASDVTTPKKFKRIWADKLEIRPPPPRSSCGTLSAERFVTKALQEVVDRLPLEIYYRPAEQKRDLQPMERGYWLLNCQNFDTALRSKCWEALGDFVSQGLGGWGVWCVRDENLETIRVYCWGVMVEHLYLLFLVFSNRKIKGTGARWIGGDGQDIVKMPA